MVKNPPLKAGDIRDVQRSLGQEDTLKEGAWRPTLVFLPGESHGQRSWWATVCRAAESGMIEVT